ncbi:histidine kinase [Sphingomonas quercus]|uniref:Histidine kinase n=1 Tax=Sphingomonas quercus TaxID=2842451 RepID=A0ABS6BDJ0_9SPHN|nr:histidine kinase [Sphingomonas quercus]MBU3076380.1 histidine kinase [Sphingomonas quercus]
MWRYLAGGVAALLLVAAGLFWWQNQDDGHGGQLGPAPFAAQAKDDDRDIPLPPPAASEATREEKRFARNDKNKDGRVSRDEFLIGRHRAFERLDANGDGRLSFEEYAASSIKRFDTADKQKDGALTAAEFATTRQVRKPASNTPRCDCSAAVEAALASRDDN